MGEVYQVSVKMLRSSGISKRALNIYTGALSLLTLDVPIKRWISVIATGILGGALALYGVNGLSSKYENFLLLISYWIGPWLAIVCVDFFLHPGQPSRSGRGLQAMQSVIEWCQKGGSALPISTYM